MGTCRSPFQYLVILLFFPALAWAECVQWVVCPYVSTQEEPDRRYVSIVDLNARFEWNEIEVAGNQALVCLPRTLPATRDVGCSVVNRTQMRALLLPPQEPYFDGAQIRFKDSLTDFNPRSIRKRIDDSAITYDDLRGRNPR